jgi:NAD(P)-dependent dehydrogenase (short-subunit alcohol dehydrogenase family)
MLDRGWGRIINISSSSAAAPAAGQAAYAAAKAGLEGFTRALAAEVGHKGISVNAVAPGIIETDMSAPLRARLGDGPWGQPEDVAALVAFLAGEEAGQIQGQVLAVDGGRTTRRHR